MGSPGFIDELVDWRDFERFISDMFGRDPNLVVEHDVTETGRSGARRQIDVKVTHRIGDMPYVTVIECKRWKDKVDRTRIDVLATTIRDLKAAKGVMFTTSGFEQGAEQYARDQGIELFVVRDLTEDEWGLPGRVVAFWWQFYAAQFGRWNLHQPQLMAIVEKPPTSVNLKLEVTKESVLDESMILHSVVDGEAGPNLMTVLLEARTRALDLLAKERNVFGGRLEDDEKFLLMPLEIDFEQSPHRQLHRDYGAIRLSRIGVELVVHVKQTKFQHDRGERFDFALAVENYLTRGREVVVRPKGADQLGVFPVKEAVPPSNPREAISENTMLCIFTEPWVSVPKLTGELYPTRKLTFELPSWTVTSSDPPSEYTTPPPT